MAKATTTKKTAAVKKSKPSLKTKAVALKKKNDKVVSSKKVKAPVTAKKLQKPEKAKKEVVKKKLTPAKVTAAKKTVKNSKPSIKKAVKPVAKKEKTITKTRKVIVKKKEEIMPQKKTRISKAKVKAQADTSKIEQGKAESGKVASMANVPKLHGKSVAHIKGYGKEELEHFRKVIIGKRDEILEQLQSLKEQMLDPSTGEYINENSPYSLHMAEQGTDAMEREKTFFYAQRENKFLSYLEDALKRIDSGTYGICIECIDEPQNLCPTCPLIPKARLEAVPHSQICVEIKKKQEKFR